MYKVGIYLLLPLMWINLTVAENRWTMLGLNPAQYIYALTIGIAWYVGACSRYRRLVTAMLMLAIIMRFLAAVGGGESFKDLGFAALAVVFAVAGAEAYGRRPSLLRKQLVIYLALCIPLMLLQILGVDSLLMGWNIGYLHDPNLLTIEEVGSFKEIPLFPTLFVDIDDLMFSTGQARPVGLMYASNPLAIFVSLAIAINLAIVRSSRLSFSDIIVTVALVLTMSKLVFGVTMLLYLFFLVFGKLGRRLLVRKLIVVLAIVMFLYYLLFPGLFKTNLSESMIMHSIMLRLVDLLKALGIENSFGQILELDKAYQSSNEVIGEGYSSVATLLRSKQLVPLLFVMVTGSIIYVYRIRNMIFRPTMIYVVTLLTCVLTQFAVPFLRASSFQLIMGFAFFPLFKKMWLPQGPRSLSPDSCHLIFPSIAACSAEGGKIVTETETS